MTAAFRDGGVHGEKGTLREGSSGRMWVIDPIDGTVIFIHGGAQWHRGIDESTWDLLAAMPILEQIGSACIIDRGRTDV